MVEDFIFESEQAFGPINNGVIAQRVKERGPIYRVTGVKSRLYFQVTKGVLMPYNSGTTAIDNYRDKEGERAIAAWQTSLINSGQEPWKVLKERQDYGTLMHMCFAGILTGDIVPYNDMATYLLDKARECRMDNKDAEYLVSRNLKEFRKDIASFHKWVVDYNVRPLAIELMVRSNRWQVATAVDLICEADFMEEGFWGDTYKTTTKTAKKGDPKLSKELVTRTIVVDFKSGKKGFWDKNVLQLLTTKDIVKEEFPEIEIHGLYNFAPKDWTGTTPSYTFTRQDNDGSIAREYLAKIKDNVLTRGLVEFMELILPKKLKTFVGYVDLNEKGEYQSPIVEKTIEEIAWEQYLLNIPETDGL